MTWVRQAPGWYTSERGDAVTFCQVLRRWDLWRNGVGYRGPYRTLAEAKRAAEE